MKDLYLAGGPYYGVQEVFSRIKGVVETTAGFANSSVPNPRKEDVENGKVQAVECVKVTYNPKKIDIGTLLSVVFYHSQSLHRRYPGEMHRTPLQDRHLLRIRRRYAADYLLYGLLPEQGQLEARERILSCFQ